MESSFEASTPRLRRELADFIPLLEDLVHQLRQLKQETESFLQENAYHTHNVVQETSSQLQEFKEILTEVGIARFRHQVETLLKHSESHLQEIAKASEHFTQLSDEKARAFSQVLIDTACEFKAITQSLETQKLQKICQNMNYLFDKTIRSTMRKLRRNSYAMFWQQLILSTCFAFIIATIFAKFILGQWPWEARQQAVLERQTGQVFIKAWGKLSQEEQEKLLHLARDPGE